MTPENTIAIASRLLAMTEASEFIRKKVLEDPAAFIGVDSDIGLIAELLNDARKQKTPSRSGWTPAGRKRAI